MPNSLVTYPAVIPRERLPCAAPLYESIWSGCLIICCHRNQKPAMILNVRSVSRGSVGKLANAKSTGMIKASHGFPVNILLAAAKAMNRLVLKVEVPATPACFIRWALGIDTNRSYRYCEQFYTFSGHDDLKAATTPLGRHEIIHHRFGCIASMATTELSITWFGVAFNARLFTVSRPDIKRRSCASIRSCTLLFNEWLVRLSFQHCLQK